MADKITIQIELDPGLKYTKTAELRGPNNGMPEEIEVKSAHLAKVLSDSIAAIYGDHRKESK
ncbi:hypothetical protein [Glutamicibacter sp.]|uniref:hypothetical protein n=1 Tax=Glutamicibacter sp. TaxID=1931995 RepID=UPI002B47BCC7|nr:hypothetical protein [Glutamicibacter sp.]HJX77304.1 hypothetical protein [Glutamicibacter sp.]